MAKPKYKKGDKLKLVYTDDIIIVDRIEDDLKGYDDYVIIDEDGFVVRVADIVRKIR